jgi:hypothetical protein
MKTNNTIHLGDGAYAGVDAHDGHQIWLGSNHHEHMTVALGPREIAVLVGWLRREAPHIAKEAGLL